MIYGFEQIFSVMRYPAGESHVEAKMIPGPDDTILAHARGFEDLCNILTADAILEHNGQPWVQWFIPYFPFGRHDRRRTRLDGLELKLALDMVDDLNLITLDPHSDVLGQLKHIPQSEVVAAFSGFIRGFDIFEDDAIVAVPDEGASKKVMMWLDNHVALQCSKRRDPRTGALSGFIVPEIPEEYRERPIVIVDDICDGGGTFIGLADEIIKQGHAGPLRLLVTHGLFTKGTGDLLAVFDRVFSTGSCANDGVERIPQSTILERSFIV